MSGLYVFLSVVVLAGPAWSCSPPMGHVPELTKAQKAHFADTIVVGKVLQTYVDHTFNYGGLSDAYHAEMKIYCIYKGDVTADVINVTHVGTIPGLCHTTRLDKGSEYVVYLQGEQHRINDIQMDNTPEHRAEVSTACGLELRYPDGVSKDDLPHECPEPASDDDCIPRYVHETVTIAGPPGGHGAPPAPGDHGAPPAPADHEGHEHDHEGHGHESHDMEGHEGHGHEGHSHDDFEHEGHEHVGHTHEEHDAHDKEHKYEHEHIGHDHDAHGDHAHEHESHDHEGHGHEGHDHEGHGHDEYDHEGHDHEGHTHEEHDAHDGKHEEEHSDMVKAQSAVGADGGSSHVSFSMAGVLLLLAVALAL